MKSNIQKIAYRAIPLVTAFVVLLSCIVVGNPLSARAVDMRSIYDGNLTKQEQNRLSSIGVGDVENADLVSYNLWRVMPWLYAQAGIDIEFPKECWSCASEVCYYLFTGNTVDDYFQPRPLTGASVNAQYFLKQFTGLRGGFRPFQESDLTYSNFNWQIGDIFVGYYTEGDVAYNYVAMYRGQDFLEFFETDGISTVSLSDMRDIFSRTYNRYAVIRPQLLADEWTAVDYNDFIENLYVDGVNDIVTFDFPSYLCGSHIDDMRGVTYLPGQDNGIMRLSASHFASGGVYLPGSYMTNTVLNLDNIPNGSIFTSSGSVALEVGDAFAYGSDYLGGFVYFGLQYYDENFNLIGANNQVVKEFSLDIYGSEYYWEMSIACNAPDNAKYCVYYGRIEIDEYLRDKEYTNLLFDFDMTSLQMSISSLYRQQEQTGKQNELLENIITGTPEQNEIAGNVTGNLNNSSDAMQGAADDLGALGDQLSAVDKPDVDSFNVSVDGLVPYQAMLAYTAPIQVLWENPTLLGMLMIIVTLVIVSWVFFGKKG